MILPEQCANLDEIRAEMDAIDRQIVALIARRVAYSAPPPNSKPARRPWPPPSGWPRS